MANVRENIARANAATDAKLIREVARQLWLCATRMHDAEKHGGMFEECGTLRCVRAIEAVAKCDERYPPVP